MTIATAPRLNPEELERLDGRFELVNGQLLEKPAMAKTSTNAANRLATELGIYLKSNDVAQTFSSEQGYRCYGSLGDDDRIRKPDLSVVLNERALADAGNTGWFRIRPDIAVEIVSTNDLAGELIEKLEEYAVIGVPLVWVLYPDQRRVEVHRGDSVTVLHEADVLAGDPVLPGLAIKVADILPRR